MTSPLSQAPKSSRPLHVLELSNLDVYGKRFNGFSIQEYINQHPALNIDVHFLVNHKFSDNRHVKPIFKNQQLEHYDWQLDALESHLGTKNQISLSEEALIHHPLYQKANILHFHMYHNMHLPIEFLTRIPADKQIILDLHDTFWLTDDDIPMLEAFASSNVNQDSLIAQRRRVLKATNPTFIIHSPYMQNLFKKSTVTKNFNPVMINFGIDLNIFKPLNDTKKLRNKYHIPANHIVLFFRAQKEFKGLNYILDALHDLKSTYPITIITVGDQNLCNSLKPQYPVINFGLVDNESTMAELYNLCDIFLAPSTEESFGFMAVEAMACGKPIIVFEGTALPYTTNAPEIGIVTKRSSNALAKAISHLIDHPAERQSRGLAAAKFAKKTYNEKSYLDTNIKLYQTLAAQPPRKTEQNQSLSTPHPDFDSIAPQITNELLQDLPIAAPIKLDYNSSTNQAQIHAFNQQLYANIIRVKPPHSFRSRLARLLPPHLKTFIKQKLHRSR